MPGTVMAIGIAIGAAVVAVVLNASGFVYHSTDVAGMKAGKLSPSMVNLKASDYLLEGAHMPSAQAYTTAYWVSLIFPALVILATALSRLRHRGGFKAVLEQHTFG
jgi:hypothetical protein